MLCKKTRLLVSGCCIGKDIPKHPKTGEMIAMDYMDLLKDDRTLRSLGFRKQAMLYLVYVGDLPDQFDPRVPLH